MNRGKNSKLSQFLQKDRKTVIVPLDHGTAIPVTGMESPAALIESLSPHVDGFVVNLGVAMACRDALDDKGVCLRIDCYKPVHGENPDEGCYRLYGPDEVEACGAHAMMNMLYPHHRNEAEIFRECAEAIAWLLGTAPTPPA